MTTMPFLRSQNCIGVAVELRASTPTVMRTRTEENLQRTLSDSFELNERGPSTGRTLLALGTFRQCFRASRGTGRAGGVHPPPHCPGARAASSVGVSGRTVTGMALWRGMPEMGSKSRSVLTRRPVVLPMVRTSPSRSGASPCGVCHRDDAGPHVDRCLGDAVDEVVIRVDPDDVPGLSTDVPEIL